MQRTAAVALTGVLLAVFVAGAEHVVGDLSRRILGGAALLVGENGHADLAQMVGHGSAFLGGSPAGRDACLAGESFRCVEFRCVKFRPISAEHSRTPHAHYTRTSLGQANRSHFTVELDVALDLQQRDVVVVVDGRVGAVPNDLGHPEVLAGAFRRGVAIVLEDAHAHERLLEPARARDHDIFIYWPTDRHDSVYWVQNRE